MERICFSIITVAFNSRTTISRTIESVINQSYDRIEYCIVDGASTDGTLDIIKSYYERYPHIIKFISEPDNGIYDAMNKGIMMSTGDVIGIVNSDDWLEPDAIEKVFNAIRTNNQDLSSLYCGGINFHFSDGHINQARVSIQSLHRYAPLYIVSGVYHPGLFVPQKVYQKIGLFNEKMRFSADLEFMLRCYYSKIQFVDIDEIVSNMSEGGISTSGSKKARAISRSDRRILLQSFGKTGLSYYWLYYSWYLRGLLKRCKRVLFK